ncbi:MAG: tetratricopeptide repeat protein, partial [Bacteroidales bacterium]
MKRTYFFLVYLFFCLHVYSQNITANDLLNALKSGDAIKAKDLADKAITQHDASTNESLWFYRGQIYLALFSSSDNEIQKLAPDALDVAYHSFLKTLELDKTKKFNKETIEALQSIATQFNYEGANLFNQKLYDKALNYFENAIKISKIPAINKLDTIVIYNAALAAEKANQIQKSINYYEQLKQYKFGGANIYLELGKLYCNNQMESKGIEVFKQGISLFNQDAIKFYNELINLYLQKNDLHEALKYTDEALKIDSKNYVLYFIKASIFEQQKNETEAEELYKKTLELNPTYQDALYNLGAMYYNRATVLLKKAMNKTEQNQAIDIYKQAQIYLETYNNNYPREEIILKMLKTIYTLTNQNDKLNQVNEW